MLSEMLIPQKDFLNLSYLLRLDQQAIDSANNCAIIQSNILNIESYEK